MSQPITNLLRPDDGFGENYKYLIISVIYAEVNQLEFVYSPFQSIQHNYDNDPDYINKKERLINFIDNFKSIDDYKSNNILIPKALNIFELIKFYHANIEMCVKSKSLQQIKNLFYSGKTNPFDTSYINIAIHIRKMNRHDYIVVDEGTKVRTPMYDELFIKLSKDPSNTKLLPGMDVPFDLYTTIIKQFESVYPNAKFHIYSQGNTDDFSIFAQKNTVLHINEPLESTFIQLVYADIIVIAPSALSYAAGLISNNKVYYIASCNPPLPHWNVVQNYKSSKMNYKFSVLNEDLSICDFSYNPYLDTFEKIV